MRGARYQPAVSLRSGVSPGALDFLELNSEFQQEGPLETRHVRLLLQRRKLRPGKGKGLVQVTPRSILWLHLPQ